MKKHNFKFLPVLGCACFLLGACGGGKTTTSVSISGSEPSVRPDQTLIKFFGWGSISELEIFGRMIASFEAEHPEYKVYYTNTSSENYLTALDQFKNNPSTMPDVFYMPDLNFIDYATNPQGCIMLDLNDYINASPNKNTILNNVWKRGLEAYRFDGTNHFGGNNHIYGLPKDLGPNVLAFNKDIALQKGITIVSEDAGTNPYGYNPDTKTLNTKIPMTWAQFVQYCKATTSGSLDQPDSVVGVTHYPLESAYMSNGSRFTDSTNKIVNISNDRFAESLQFVADLSNKYKVMTTAEGQATQGGLSRFTSNQASTTFLGAWDTPTVWKCNFDWDILYTPVPNANGDLDDWQDGYRSGCQSKSYLGSVGFSVYKDSRVKQAAYDLAEYLTINETAQRQNYKAGQAVPNLIDMAKGEFLTEAFDDPKGKNRPANREVYVDMMENSERRPQAYTLATASGNDNWWTELWDSKNEDLQLYRVWHLNQGSFSRHLDVWDWDTHARTVEGTKFLSDLQASCQKYMDDFSSEYFWD